MLRITVYGILKPDYKPSDYSLVDMVYFLDADRNSIDYRDLLRAIINSGFDMQPMRGPGGKIIDNKITIDEMNIGIETREPQGPGEPQHVEYL